MCTVLAVTTGCEHALATWLAPLGVAEGALGEQRMPVMSSTFSSASEGERHVSRRGRRPGCRPGGI
eukprot:8696-Prymnesium_polylepis.1